MDNPLNCQSRDCKIDFSLFWSFGSDFKPKSHIRMTLMLGGTLNPSSLTHFFEIIAYVKW